MEGDSCAMAGMAALRESSVRRRVSLASTSILVVILLVAVSESALFARAMHGNTGGRWILPVDDAYIHEQYAKQLARGYFFRYNDGDPPSSGDTSLLYPIILAGAWGIGFRGDLLSAFAFSLAGACLLVSALLLARIAGRMYVRFCPDCDPKSARWVSLLAAMLFLSDGALLWGFFAGMETGLFVALLLATLEALIAGRFRAVALWGGLLALTRPEGVVLVVAMALVVAAEAHWRAGRSNYPRALILPPLCGLVQPTLNLVLTGSPAASAVRAKSWLANVPFVPRDILLNLLNTARDIWTPFVTGLAPAAFSGFPMSLLRSPARVTLYMPPFLAVAGLVYLVSVAIRNRQDDRGMLAAVVLLWIVLGLMFSVPMRTATWQYHRYQLAYFALGLLAGALAIAAVVSRIPDARWRMPSLVTLGCLALIVSGYSIPGFLVRYGSATRTTLNQQVRLGEWIAANLPPNARVGVGDAGAIRYYGERPIYDIVGLTGSMEASLAWAHGSGSEYEAMERASDRPTFFAVYDDVHESPYFVKTNLFHRELFRAVDSDVAEIAFSDHQVVFSADWSLLNSGDAVYQPDVLEATQNMTLVDSIDVASLADEASHEYRWWNALRKPSFPTEVFQLSYYLLPNRQVMDGGRLITGGEAFTMRTVPGQSALLVGRFLGQSSVHLQVRVNGQVLGPWGYGPIPGRWQEQKIEIPAAMITGTRTRVEIQVDATRPDLEFHRPFYYWCYQGTPVEEAPRIVHPLNAALGDGIALVGYSLAQAKTESAYQVHLDLYWQASKPVAGDYKVFVHWSDEKDTVLTQQDRRPCDDMRPTWTWRFGEVVADHYTLALPLDRRSSKQTVLYVGMYDPLTGVRLPIAGGDAANRLLLASLTLPF